MAHQEKKKTEATTTHDTTTTTYNLPTQTGDPQTAVIEFWKTFHAEPHGAHVTSILDNGSNSEDPQLVEGRLIDGEEAGSYNAARKACIRRVRDVIRECERNNERFTDLEFDIKSDFHNGPPKRDCLRGLKEPDLKKLKQLSQSPQPQSLRRIGEIFSVPILAPNSASICLDSCLYGRNPTWWQKLSWCYTSIRPCFQGYTLLLPLAAVAGCLNSYVRFIAATIECLSGLLLLRLLFRSVRITKPPNFTSSQIKQGRLGDCWFLSAVASLASRDDLLLKICVAWHQPCGVYGFVFYRDGAWTYTVVDDYLYLKNSDLKEEDLTTEKGEKYRRGHQTGSTALHFAKCRDSNQFWLPLLEKAYAKIHGDYDALGGGQSEEGLEDLTGGVASTIRTDSIMGKDRLWDEILNNSEKDNLYALTSPVTRIDDIAKDHAYAIEKAANFFDPVTRRWHRLLRIRNPWGQRHGVWQGAFANGSKEMTPFASWWLRKTGDDGVFYMTFEDALRIFRAVNRTRVFNEFWTIRQSWSKLIVDWTPSYNSVYYLLTLTPESEVVFSLSQLNTRYFRGLEGRYVFHLEFLVRLQNSQPGEYVARATAANEYEQCPRRSASLEKKLPKGTYEILVKISAFHRNESYVWSVEVLLRKSTERPKKLQQIARNYDTAYGKLVDINPAPMKHEKITGGKTQEKEKSVSMICEPAQVAWNAVCGVGLRVFSQDPEMRLELRHRGQDSGGEDSGGA